MTPVEITLGGIGGEYMESAVLVEWRAADGARVAAGDVVAVVETAKAATDVEAPADGVLHILVPQGEEVAVGTVLARLGEAAAPAPIAAAGISAPAAPLPGLKRRWQTAYASPLAKRIAAERGIDLHALRGSGPAGRIVHADLPDAAPRLADAGAAGFTIAVEAHAAALLARRADRWDAGERPCLGDMVAEAARDALRRQGIGWPVLLLDEADAPPAGALAVIDLAAFGVIAFAPPRLPCRAVLGICAPSAANHSPTLHLSLTADAQDLSCAAAARFLATLRDLLEVPSAV
jgi:pyruvate/2-oxoglutarate dehydrogenase complex dihydrolipoamide acyltransferase (E2) component